MMCDSCGWEDLLVKIDDALESGEFDWASDTLEGIQTWVNDEEHCTEPQERAVNNIVNCRH